MRIVMSRKIRLQRRKAILKMCNKLRLMLQTIVPHYNSKLTLNSQFQVVPLNGCSCNLVLHIQLRKFWIILDMYGVRNLEKTIRFSLKSWPSERFHWPEMSQIKAEISLRTNVKLIFHKNVGWQGYQWIP